MASRWKPWANPLLAYWKHGCDNPTAAEAALEPAIAALGERYRHQFPFWGLKYFADFALLDRKLIIEVDGDSHNTPEQKEKDLQHTLAVLELGWLVFRCSNFQATYAPGTVIKAAQAYLESAPDKELLIAESTAALAQLRQDYPYLLAAAAKKATRRSQSAKVAAARRARARGKQSTRAPAKSSKRPAESEVKTTPHG